MASTSGRFLQKIQIMDTAKPVGFDIEGLNALIRSRRSVFTDQFARGRSVPDTLVRAILENALWAPTHKKTEPWRFTVFTGKGLERLAQFQSELYKKNAGTKFRLEKFEKLRDAPIRCSHVIAIGMKRSSEVEIPEVEEIAAVSCAVQNMYLSVTALGLGAYWGTGGITYDPEAKAFFGLGKPDRLMGFFNLGYPEIPSPPGHRTGLEARLSWVAD
jgi:nitroreductase